MPLISLEQAKQHLRLPPSAGSPPGSPLTDEDLDLQLKIDAAEALVLDYVAQRRTDTASPAWLDQVVSWDLTTVPPVIAAAVLLQLGELWRFRGDDETGPARPHGHLSPMITAILHRYRDPALA